MRRTLLLAIAAAALVAGLSAAGDARAQPATTTIDVGDFYFCDSSFEGGVCETTVDEGDTVMWEWVGANLHSTTECGGDLDSCPGPHVWDSPVQDSGTFSYTFDTAGAFAYRCQVHPQLMRGVVNVVAAQEETPTPTPTPEQSTPEATEMPTDDGAAEPTAAPAAVPSGGGPPGEGGASAAWWALAAGGLLIVAGGVFVATRQRR